MNLTEFMLARIAEDEVVARAAICQCGGGNGVCTPERGWYHEGEAMARLEHRGAAQHVMRFGPARVLAECKAKRRIVEHHGVYHVCLDPRSTGLNGEAIYDEDYPCEVVRLLALPLANHPDYEQEWAL